jgi:outer membrane receptor protein involved in Fe transport
MFQNFAAAPGAKVRVFCAALACALLTALSTAPAFADATGLVRGVVRLDGNPTYDVTLTLAGEGTTRTVKTEAQGNFSFTRVPFGRYTLTAHRDGVSDVVRQVDVQSNSVATLLIDLQTIKEIGRAQAGLVRGVASAPVGVNTLGHEQIATMPDSQSLSNLITTMPGIVQFSYNEPVAHGFHGLTYELDGVPLPQGTASNFSEIIDPRTIDSLEVITGAFPAEYGGFRQGAVVNIISHRATDLSAPEQGYLTVGGGNYAGAQASLGEQATLGNTRFFFNANTERTDRGLDSPTFIPQHDNASQANEFLRTITNVGKNDVLAFDASNNYATFQIPINTQPTPTSPVAVPPGTDDVQLEYDNFFNLSYTHNAKDGNSYTQIAPWYHYDRIVYAGDLANDVQGNFYDFTQDPPAPTPLGGLRQDRSSTFTGLRLVHFHVFGDNALKAGIDQIVENYAGTEQIAYYDENGALQNFFDNSAQRGTLFDAFIQDKWTPTPYLSLFAGLRYDHSTGYVSGSQLSPRIEFNANVDPLTIVHAYYGRLYAAPFLEDTRRAAVITGGGNPDELPIYDLQPEHDSYYEFGLAHQFAPGARAYFNLWKRDVTNVLDTTQLASTPIFAVYNNSIGISKGVEGRVDARWSSGDTMFFSVSLSSSQAGGISGGTFLFCPTPSTSCSQSIADVTLNPEDHDQTFATILNYTKRFGADRSFFASLQPDYGTGYPVQFQNGTARLTPHLTIDASIGRDPQYGSHRRLGFTADLTNVANYAYVVKINNGFNTTQWAPGFHGSLRVTIPF